MDLNFLSGPTLSPAARKLIQFDIDSIRQFVAAQRTGAPDIWLVDPAAYERNGRVLRDSEGSRMLALSLESQIIYATDGCNSCMRRLPHRLEEFSPEEVARFAETTQCRADLLERLAELARSRTA